MDRDEAAPPERRPHGGGFHGDSCGAADRRCHGTGASCSALIAPECEEADKLLIEKVHEFQKRFLEENGSLLCRQLLGGYDKADPDAVAPDDAGDNCARYCASACRILDSLIGDRYIR
ncbi:MAG: C-GCAxxG-C-C family (seleno)protein [Oscillospiraceae bacterium]